MEVYDVTGSRELLTIDKAKVIADSIMENASTLKKVILRTKTYSADVAKIIGDALSQVKGLESLDLSDIISGLSFDDAQRTFEIFADCLKELHLKFLDLSDNAMGPKGILSCTGLICGKTELEVLLLNNDGMSGESCENIRDIIKKVSPMNLRRIEFFNNMSGDMGAKAVAEMIECLPKLEVFRWSSTRTNEEGAIALCNSLINCPNMVRLEIRDNYFGENCGELLGNALAVMKGLRELVLADISLGDSGVVPILKAIKENDIHLRYQLLDISLNDITEETIQYLCEMLTDQIEMEHLLLSDNYLGSHNICILINTLEKYCPNLKLLNLKVNEIGPKAAELVVKMCDGFERLDLDGNQISDESMEVIRIHLEDKNKSGILAEMSSNDNEWTSEEYKEIEEFFTQ